MLGIRPEDLVIAERGLAFRVQVVEPLGSHLLLTGEAEGQRMRALVPPDTIVQAGSILMLRPDESHLAWMHPDTGVALETA